MSDNFIPCTVKQLRPEDLLEGARNAIKHNPANRSPVEKLLRIEPGLVIEPGHLALLTEKYWGVKGVKLGVYFMDTKDTKLQARILLHMNAWGEYANVQFALAAAGSADVRIARTPGDGYWSYLGTDIRMIPRDQPTMNLDSFSLQTPESEYRRVVRHETGHTLGFPHEHLRKELVAMLDREKTIAYFMESQGWLREEVIQQVLTPLEDRLLQETPTADAMSIMCYQLPGSITTDGKPIPGGLDIDAIDGDFAGKRYPRIVTPPVNPPGSADLEVTIVEPGRYRLVKTT